MNKKVLTDLGPLSSENYRYLCSVGVINGQGLIRAKTTGSIKRRFGMEDSRVDIYSYSRLIINPSTLEPYSPLTWIKSFLL